MLLDGLGLIFSSTPDYEVVAKGRCADDAVSIAERLQPDVLIIDLSMPGNAFEAIQKIVASAPAVKIIAFTAIASVEYAVRALEAGARGYVLKGSTVDELAQALASVLAGETYVTPIFASKVITALRNASRRSVEAEAVKLSIREGQIVKLLLRGCTNKEIGEDLQISEKTVRHYMTLLMRKLNVRNRVEAVIAAQRLSAEQAIEGVGTALN